MSRRWTSPIRSGLPEVVVPPLPEVLAPSPAEAAAAPARAAAEPAGGLRAGDLTAGSEGGIAGDAGRVFVPTGYEPGYAYPLIVWLPDPRRPSFDLGRTMARVSLRNHVAVQPIPAPGDADTEAAVWRAVDRVQGALSIHRGRVFLVGHGRGGTDAFRIGCRHAGAFAGVVSLGGPFPHGERALARLADVRRLPMLFCCRKEAPAAVLRPTEATLRLFHAAGATLAMRIYPGRDDLSRMILADVNRWLMDEICGVSADRTVAPA